MSLACPRVMIIISAIARRCCVVTRFGSSSGQQCRSHTSVTPSIPCVSSVGHFFVDHWTAADKSTTFKRICKARGLEPSISIDKLAERGLSPFRPFSAPTHAASVVDSGTLEPQGQDGGSNIPLSSLVWSAGDRRCASNLASCARWWTRFLVMNRIVHEEAVVVGQSNTESVS